jgi:MFS family permease
MAPELKQRLTDGLTMFVVTLFSLLLLVYVGFGEANRTLSQFHIENITAQGRIVQGAMEAYLRAGLPLQQYAGFKNLADPIVESKDVDALIVFNESGKPLFSSVDRANPEIPAPGLAVNHPTNIQILDTKAYYQIVIPLRNRFEVLGSVVISSPKKVIAEKLGYYFSALAGVAALASAVFAGCVTLFSKQLERSKKPWLQIGYGFAFVGVAGVLVAALVSLYASGLQGKTNSAAIMLAQRLGDVVEFNLRFRDFSGLDRTFAEYRRLNPEISEAALIIDDVVQISTMPDHLGKKWQSEGSHYEYMAEMTKADVGRRAAVAVKVPADLVYSRVEKSIRNFFALFVATAFVAGLFLQVGSSLRQLRTNAGEAAAWGLEAGLVFIKPVFFLAVFMENITYSFLSKFMQQAALSSGVSVGFASAPFTAYYLCFAISLIPAGHFSDRFGPKVMIVGGVLLSAVGLMAVGLPLDIFSMTVLRGLSGIGQGALFIGVQSYVLAVSSQNKKTQAAAIIVFGFQGGMISGMAIGSLLVTSLGATGVFVLSGFIGVLTAAYSICFLPSVQALASAPVPLWQAMCRVGSDLRSVLGSGEFIRTILCIGAPAKAILTGAITFALPLLLTGAGFAQEEIGQVIMVYGLGVVAVSGVLSRAVDRTGSTELVLFWGATLSGVGLLLVGLMDTAALGTGSVRTALVIAGVLTVGIAHGFINAPVVTHVANSALASEVGGTTVTTTYRFLERAGHVAGPLLVGQLLLFAGRPAAVMTWIGTGTVLLALLFVARWPTSRPSNVSAEAH